MKTVASGGGYGVLNLMVTNNSDLYESSTISTIAIALIPIILWLARFGTIFPPDWRVKAFCRRTDLRLPADADRHRGAHRPGLHRRARRCSCSATSSAASSISPERACSSLASVPFLPDSFTGRMSTIQGYQSDQSAKVRAGRLGLDLELCPDNPMGGGFGAYLGNRIEVRTVTTQGCRRSPDRHRADRDRPGPRLAQRLFRDARRAGLSGPVPVPSDPHRRAGPDGGDCGGATALAEGDKAWIAPLATALQHFQIIYLVGASFVAIAYHAVHPDDPRGRRSASTISSPAANGRRGRAPPSLRRRAAARSGTASA